jgi:hypothetical protein
MKGGGGELRTVQTITLAFVWVLPSLPVSAAQLDPFTLQLEPEHEVSLALQRVGCRWPN